MIDSSEKCKCQLAIELQHSCFLKSTVKGWPLVQGLKNVSPIVWDD